MSEWWKDYYFCSEVWCQTSFVNRRGEREQSKFTCYAEPQGGKARQGLTPGRFLFLLLFVADLLQQKITLWRWGLECRKVCIKLHDFSYLYPIFGRFWIFSRAQIMVLEKVCKNCGKKFIANNRKEIFCCYKDCRSCGVWRYLPRYAGPNLLPTCIRGTACSGANRWMASYHGLGIQLQYS